MTPTDVNNILALARVLATKRVRRFAVRTGHGAPNETHEGTINGVKRAEHELECYLSALVYGCYWIVDDVIDEKGNEGYEVMYGNPFDATGVSQFQSKFCGDCTRYIKQKNAEFAYRVKLARRHKVPSVKLLNLEKA